MAHAVDAIVREFVFPALKPLGFRHDARVLFRETSTGDVASIELRARAGGRECWVIFGVVAAVSIQHELASGPSKRTAMMAEPNGLFRRRLTVPGETGAGADRWSFDPADPESVASTAQLILHTIESEALPILDRCGSRAGIREFLSSIPASERIRWLAPPTAIVERLLRLDTDPPDNLLAEIEQDMQEPGGADAFTKWQARYVLQRMANEEAFPTGS